MSRLLHRPLALHVHPLARIGVGFALLLAAWVFGGPQGAGPDENGHYVRAEGLAQGQLIGTPSAPGPRGTNLGHLYRLPPEFFPQQFQCNAGNPHISAACADAPGLPHPPPLLLSSTLPYTPFGYLLPGLFMTQAHDATEADTLGRVGSGLINLALLTAILALAWRPRQRVLALLGVLVAATPLVFALGSELGPNGHETLGLICFVVGLLRIVAAEGTARGWVWWLSALGGAVLVLSRPLGPLFLAPPLILTVAFFGWRATFRALIPARSRASAIAAEGLVVLSLAGAAGWHLAQASRQTTGATATALSYLAPSVAELPLRIHEAIGGFGWKDSALIMPYYAVWDVLAAGLVATAVIVGTRRERWSLIVLVGAGSLVCVVMSAYLRAAFEASTPGLLPEYRMQGRYLLPILVLLPLFAGQVVLQHAPAHHHRTTARLTAIVVASVGLVQGAAWYLEARRHAVGSDGSLVFLFHAAWRPRVGWGAIVGLAVLGTLLIGSAGLTSERETDGLEPGDARRVTRRIGGRRRYSSGGTDGGVSA